MLKVNVGEMVGEASLHFDRSLYVELVSKNNTELLLIGKTAYNDVIRPVSDFVHSVHFENIHILDFRIEYSRPPCHWRVIVVRTDTARFSYE